MHRCVLPVVALAAVLTLAACGSTHIDADAGAGTSVQWETSAPEMPSAPPPLPPAPTDEIIGPAPSTPPTTQASASATSSAGGCSLPHTGDLIWWEKWPGTPAQVSMLGDINILECKYSWETLADTEPTGPGYCDILARPADNPGYDMNATPPPRPKNILAEAGAGC